MELNLWELKEIERLLTNRMNACPDPDIGRLLHKTRKEISGLGHKAGVGISHPVRGSAKEGAEAVGWRS